MFQKVHWWLLPWYEIKDAWFHSLKSDSWDVQQWCKQTNVLSSYNLNSVNKEQQQIIFSLFTQAWPGKWEQLLNFMSLKTNKKRTIMSYWPICDHNKYSNT